ncbi:hypothetical protein J3L16_08465 [Alteromonas sp. 5E99-2]|uniref:hypothetical protein n=1 Tax=Alteromonas sp. 5E99-2 TaxID=2817683 RepID=UPI001A997D07|nr:hypothetical protein [Alteromonas sp. 5E99-2]MBO1255715.1 hypothetical protein [Alteromonas sp. 5E99-2]
MKVAFLIILLFLTSYHLKAEERFLSHEEVPKSILSKIKEGAKHTVSQMHEQGISHFDYNEASVKFLSEVITDERLHLSDNAKRVLPEIWGAFLGEVIIEELGGKWVKFGDQYAVLVSDSHLCFPMNKVHEQISNGQIDSIYAFYLSTARIANEISSTYDGT